MNREYADQSEVLSPTKIAIMMTKEFLRIMAYEAPNCAARIAWAFIGKARQSVSRAPRTRTTSKAAAKKAGGDSGDPDPEPRPLHSHACLTLPVFWQLLRPDNPGKNDLTNTQTDHATACASASAIVFWSCSK